MHKFRLIDGPLESDRILESEVELQDEIDVTLPGKPEERYYKLKTPDADGTLRFTFREKAIDRVRPELD